MGGNGLRKGGRSKKKGNKNKKNARPKLRFKFGQRVDCTIDGGWVVGTGATFTNSYGCMQSVLFIDIFHVDQYYFFMIRL